VGKENLEMQHPK